MKPSTVQAALSVVLRLAAAPALVACGGAQSGPSETAGASSPTPTSTTSTVDPADEPPTDCREVVKAAVDKALGATGTTEREWYNPDTNGTVSAPQAIACCEELAAEDMETGDYRATDCCHVALDARKFCTPWGPPMPRAMGWA